MRRPPEAFDEQDLTLLHVARKLRDALRLEQLLTDAGIDYVVESDEYSAGTLFPRMRVGAFFYVSSASYGDASDVLRRGGFTPAS